jgi:hypothetical protein
MFYRLFVILSLTIIVLSTIGIGASLLMGNALPQDLQFLWAAPRQNRWQTLAQTAPFPIDSVLYSTFRPNVDQWSTVGLYSTERRLSATRQLPVKTPHFSQWDKSGQFVIVSGERNGFSRVYQLSFTENDSRKLWLPTSVPQPLSPDGRKVLVYQWDSAGRAVGLRAVPFEQVEQYPPEETSRDRRSNGWGYVSWKEDSSYFLYSWTLNSDTPKPYELQLIEMRLHEVNTGAEQVLDLVNPNMGGNVNVLNDLQLRLEMKTQPLPVSVVMDRNLQYNTLLYDYQTGEEILLSKKALNYATWSADGRYLLFSESIPTYVQTASESARRLFVDRSSSNQNRWNVFYQPIGHFLIPMDEIYSPYYSSWGHQMFGGHYGLPFGMRAYTTRTYVFDTQTGEKREIGSSTEYGDNYYVQWVPGSSILTINADNPPRQYYLRPGEEPVLLQFEGEALVTGFNAVRTVASTIAQDNSGGYVQTFPYGSPSLPGQSFTIPTYYIVDFEQNLIAPLALAEDEMVGGVDVSLNAAGIDVGIMTSMIYTNTMISTSTNPMQSSLYLLTKDGVIKVRDRLVDTYVQPFAISPKEFVLVFVNYSIQYGSVNTTEMILFIEQDGIWQERELGGTFTGLLSWRPRPINYPTNDTNLQ